MRGKKFLIILILLIFIILMGGYLVYKYVDIEIIDDEMEEYIPQEEITVEQERNTILTLYFVDKETKEIMPEARVIDIKEMINLPYETLLNLLIEGPKNEKLEKVMPENVKINMVYKEGDCLTIDFTKEILNYDIEDATSKDKIVECIVNTLTELTEINKVKILIDGQENEEFTEIYERKE